MVTVDMYSLKEPFSYTKIMVHFFIDAKILMQIYLESKYPNGSDGPGLHIDQENLNLFKTYSQFLKIWHD